MPLRWKRKTVPRKRKEERQQEIAYEVYERRQLLGRPGDAQSDWQTAQKIVASRWRTTLFVSHRRFIELEKRAWEPLLAWANNQALLGLLGVIGNVGLIIAVATYVGSEKQRRDAEVLNAWQTLTSAHGQTGNGGRRRALEFLNASPGANWRRRFPWFCAPHPLCTWPAESLAGINLSVDGVEVVEESEESQGQRPDAFLVFNRRPSVYLALISLPNADLEGANLEGASLVGSESGRG